MKKTVSIIFFTACVFILSFAQETYNLEIIFKRTNWDPDTIRCYGNALSTAGDVNQDGYDDIVYSVFFDNWYGYGYVFFGGNPMDTIPDLILKCEGEGQPLMSICSGDVNGDSISDVIIGEGQAGNWGKVFIYFGGAGMDSLPDMTLNGEPLNAWPFGISVACGDVNGDSFGDLVIGSHYNGDLNGRVYIYYGGPLLDTIPDVIINGHNGEAFGHSVGSGGDVNSDGFEDIVVGADENSEAYPGAGKVYVFLGGDPMDTLPDCWLYGEGPLDWLGWFGCDIMKVQGGYDNVITASRMCGGGSYGQGKVYILYGGDPMDTIPDVCMIGKTDSSSLGNWCSSAGDVNSDGYEDALAGAPNDFEFSGCGYIWLGSASMDSIEDAYLKGNINFYGIGWKVASAGDVNGDGYDEVMFSNYASDSNQTVWVCRYTADAVAERNAYSVERRAEIEVYPNPFSKLINISFGRVQSAESIELKIYDVSGREVVRYELKQKDKKISIDCRNLPAGVYFVEAATDGESVVKKVVKIK